MSSPGLVESFLGSLEPNLKRVLVETFRYVMSDNRLGGNQKASNFGWIRFTGTTHVDTNTEFSIVHGQAVLPRHLVHTLDLNLIGSQCVPLTVTRAPDVNRVYLSSPTTNAQITIFLEFES